MNTEQKSFKLAELLHGRLIEQFSEDGLYRTNDYKYLRLDNYTPYEDSDEGLAQFAAILLRFPEVFNGATLRGDKTQLWCDMPAGYIQFKDITQANILDEILRMNGIDPDA